MENGGQFSIAGWQADVGDYHDVESGHLPFEDSNFDEADLEIVVFHYADESGNDVYYTVYGPFDDYDSMEAIIDDVLDRYGVE